MKKSSQALIPSYNDKADSAEKQVSSVSIPVIEERAKVEKHLVESGTVRIEKKVHKEDVVLDIPVEHEEMEVKRVEINQYVQTAPPAMRYEGDTMIISVLKEVTVTEKRLMLVEELRVTKRKVKDTVHEKVTLRKEEVTVNRIKREADGKNSEIL